MLNNIKKLWASITTTASPQSQTSAPETASSSQSLTIDREIVPESPFTIVGTPKHGYWLTMGKHRLTKPLKTKKEVYKLLKQKPWSLMTSVMISFIHDRKLVDQAYSYDMSIPPETKSQQLSMELNKH